MLLRDEVKRIGMVALVFAALLVILAFMVQAAAWRAPSAPSAAAEKVQDRMPQRVPTESFYRDAVVRDAAIADRQQMVRGSMAPRAASPAWLTAETHYQTTPLPPERPPERTGEAPTAVAAPAVAHQKETGRPEKAACQRVGWRTVWSGRYRWRCKR